jgi:uncharacterized protein (TIGR02996 family)
MSRPGFDATGQALLRFILENPADDGARLVYADWLEEHDQEARAEFIRVQCELARTPRREYFECEVCGASPNEEGEVEHGRGCFTQSEDGGGSEWVGESPRWVALFSRERWLLRTHWHAWGFHPPSDEDVVNAGPTYDDTEPLTISLNEMQQTFRRGFVAEVRCTLDAWLAHGPAVVRQQPVQVVRPDYYAPMQGGDPNTFTWFNAGRRREPGDDESDLPERVFLRLTLGESTHPDVWLDYPNRELADSALSRACLALAKEAHHDRVRLQ